MTGHLLSDQQRKRLEEYIQTANDLQSKRAQLILLYDDGWMTYKAAEQAGFSRSQARYWKHQFLLNGFDIFPGLMESDVQAESVELGEVTPPEEEILTPSKASEDLPGQGGLPFPPILARPGILPQDPLAEAGRKIWLFQFAQMIAKEGPTRLGEDIEDLHEMRVATRRMRTAYDIFQNTFKPKIIKRQLRGLRATGRALGRVRDMDVLIEKLTAYANTQDELVQRGLEPLLLAWNVERETSRQELLNYLGSKDYFLFKNEFNYFVQTPGYGSLVVSPDSLKPNLVCEVVPALIYQRLGAVRAYDSILNNASDLQLHALRIEFKKLRYAVEYFKEVLSTEASEVIQDLKVMQDHLGDFHDAVVACSLITAFLKEWEKGQSDRQLIDRQNPENIVSYLAYLHAERHRLLVTLPQAWAHFNRSEFRANIATAVSVL